ncbi:4-hydroxy-tetrahydrodipicolinate synthase [Kangiella sp.]|uniref:4-hydroxy-tetrahydrodipicolinate synthase n=1 Tax=Kangiella sp. TaxID=1920245 RepID=UPI0019A8CC72|nr:4-hydroxy-tetrahydrodipicolinate synthase [Kangiella sp.]MBD3653653.1 4-hydroxy-tetrahydrodipicolinate synthase [Kangiella sp.]
MFSGSIVAIVSPLQADGSIDENALKELIEWHIDQGTHGIVIMGTTGESATVDSKDYEAAIKLTVTQVAGRVPVIAGTGAISTQKTIALTKQAEAMGVDGALVVTPYYCKPSQQGLFEHFKAVAENTKLPIILYNVPGRTACDLLPETVARLADIENIVAIKEATGDLSRVEELNRLCSTPITLLSGDDATALEFMKRGGHGVISVTANVAPALMSKMCELAQAEQWKQATVINEKLSALHQDLFVEANPIPVKWALAKLGKCQETILLPLTVLAEQYHSQVLQALEQANVEIK